MIKNIFNSVKDEVMEIAKGNRVIDARRYFAMTFAWFAFSCWLNNDWQKKYSKLNEGWRVFAHRINDDWYSLSKEFARKFQDIMNGEVDTRNFTESEIKNMFVKEFFNRIEELH